MRHGVSVAGLLIVNNKALLIRRAKTESFLPGYYELPGGKVELSEKPEKSLEREFQEETNLTIKVRRPYSVFTYDIAKDETIHVVEIVYFVELVGDLNKLKLSKEHDDYKWIKFEDLSTLKLSDQIKKNIEEGFKLITSEFS